MQSPPDPPPGYRTQSADTDYWAERLLFDHWRRLTPLEKAETVSAMCASVHELSLVGLRERHPEADREELELRASALRLGADVVLRLTGRRFDRR